MKKDSSPEEKLLRLIRGQKTSSPSKTSSTVLPSRGLQQKLMSKLSRIRIQDIQRFLWVVLLLSFVYLMSCLLVPLFVKQRVTEDYTIKEEQAEIVEEKIRPEEKPYNFYQEIIAERQIFGTSTTERAGFSQVQSGSTITEHIKDLNLLGIIFGDNPQAIIEDKKTQKTYFLKRGEFFGAIKVKEIDEGKVTLELQGQRFDLFL
jgi:type II secretory pathway component PulC